MSGEGGGQEERMRRAASRRDEAVRLFALVWKESIQIVRDPSSILIAFVLPLILLFLFGYGVSLDATKIRIGLVVEASGEAADSLAAAFRSSPFFEARVARDRRAFEEDLVAGRVLGIIVIPARFGEKAAKGAFGGPAKGAPGGRIGGGPAVRSPGGQIQVLTDGSQPNTARFVENYARGVWANWLQQRGGTTLRRPSIEVEARFWFNPELKSRHFLVPGSVAIVMTLIGSLLTALVVAREWERGSMEAMMATPVTVAELILGKLIPYFLLALCSMALCAGLGVGLFGTPFRGSPFALALVTSAFLLPALGQGLLISSAAKNQFVASQAALLTAFLPAFLLSGFIFEISSMPTAIQLITYIVPARYLIPCLQTVFLSGDVWALLLPNIAVMVFMGGVLLFLAARTTRKRLD